MSLTKSKTPLPSKNVPPKKENEFTEQKQGSLSEDIAINAISELRRGSQRRKRVYLANTSLPEAKTRLPSESVPQKVGNFFPTQMLRQKSLSRAKTHINERIRVYIAKTEGRKRVYRADIFLTKGEKFTLAKTWPGKAVTLLPRENVARKGERELTK